MRRRRSGSLREKGKGVALILDGGGKKGGTVASPVGRSAGIDPEFGEHDGDDMVPVVEEDPVQERGKLLEEHHPGAVAEAEGAVAVVEEFEGRVYEEGQEIGDVAISVAEVVLETGAPDLQRLDVLVG